METQEARNGDNGPQGRFFYCPEGSQVNEAIARLNLNKRKSNVKTQRYGIANTSSRSRGASNKGDHSGTLRQSGLTHMILL